MGSFSCWVAILLPHFSQYQLRSMNMPMQQGRHARQMQNKPITTPATLRICQYWHYSGREETDHIHLHTTTLFLVSCAGGLVAVGAEDRLGSLLELVPLGELARLTRLTGLTRLARLAGLVHGAWASSVSLSVSILPNQALVIWARVIQVLLGVPGVGRRWHRGVRVYRVVGEGLARAICVRLSGLNII